MNMTPSSRAFMAISASSVLVASLATGAMADPGHGRGKGQHPGNPTPTTSVTLSSVDIKGHRPINVFSAATLRPLRVRATVKDKHNNGTSRIAVAVTLDQYTAKHGTPTTTPALAWNTEAGTAVKSVAMTVTRTKRNDFGYTGSYTFPVGAVAPGTVATVCLATATATPLPGQAVTVKVSRKVTKKTAGGDCVRVINVDPATQADRH